MHWRSMRFSLPSMGRSSLVTKMPCGACWIPAKRDLHGPPETCRSTNCVQQGGRSPTCSLSRSHCEQEPKRGKAV